MRVIVTEPGIVCEVFQISSLQDRQSIAGEGEGNSAILRSSSVAILLQLNYWNLHLNGISSCSGAGLR